MSICEPKIPSHLKKRKKGKKKKGEMIRKGETKDQIADEIFLLCFELIVKLLMELQIETCCRKTYQSYMLFKQQWYTRLTC